jgi:DnaK suppressor protein
MPVKKKAIKKAAAKKPTKKAAVAKKPAAAKKKVVAKKSPAKKASVKKAAPKKAVTKKAPAKKPALKKAAPKKAPAKKSKAKKAPAAEGVSDFIPYKTRKGEEYMGDQMKEHFRMLLISWKKELMEEVDRTVHHMQDEAANFPDPNDRASQESEFTLELRTRDRERKLIKKIDESISDIDDDEYGYCESCGVEIGVRRLEARPTATLCIDCKTLDEIREKQRG